MSADRTEIEDIARMTVGQSENLFWRELRRGRLSVNLFKKAYDTAFLVRTNPNSLAAADNISYWGKALFNYCDIQSPALEYGNLHEPIAIAAYQESTGTRVKHSGMWLDVDRSTYSCPDGLVYSLTEPRTLKGIIEVKCPINVKYRYNHDGSCRKPDVDYIDANDKLKINHKYYFQIQGHLMATKAEWCELIVWMPKAMHIERIYPDPDWQEQIMPEIKWVLFNHLLPQLKPKHH